MRKGRLNWSLVVATHLTTRPTVKTRSCVPRWRLLLALVIGIALLASVQSLLAQTVADFHRTFTVNSAEIVTLDVDVATGDLQVTYGRDGEVSITASSKSPARTGVTSKLLQGVLSIEQTENHIRMHSLSSKAYEEPISVLYRIDVPYRTQLTSKVNSGSQMITGILGPVDAVTNKGDIKAAYLSNQLKARVGIGNLDLQVIGGHVDAIAACGNIYSARLPQGVNAETGDGDVTLMVVGASTAIVKNGTGRIDVGGARGSFIGSTDRGNLHVKAVPHQDWQLNSASGDVHVEIPPSTAFELEASTKTGELQLDRDDIIKPDANALEFHQAVHGGGKRITVHTESGRIAIR